MQSEPCIRIQSYRKFAINIIQYPGTNFLNQGIFLFVLKSFLFYNVFESTEMLIQGLSKALVIRCKMHRYLYISMYLHRVYVSLIFRSGGCGYKIRL